ncbi:MAG: DUF1003 domain-containing protein [Betaproteobacteria bacterium]|nr:DUF1003 domain-containing protein [Betaproteobacteria bacterium]
MKGLQDRAALFGVAILDATTRTWAAFWGTLAVWLFYWAWNSSAGAHYRFDPYPFVFLTLLITMASYLQNIVLMTDQRKAAIEMAVVRRKQDEQDQHMLHMMEAVKAAADVLIKHASLVDRRDIEIITRLRELSNDNHSENHRVDAPSRDPARISDPQGSAEAKLSHP